MNLSGTDSSIILNTHLDTSRQNFFDPIRVYTTHAIRHVRDSLFLTDKNVVILMLQIKWIKKGMCDCSDLEPHRPPPQQQPWELCCLQLWVGRRTKGQVLIEGTQDYCHIQKRSVKMLWLPGFGRFSANLLRLVRLSAPSWFRIPGSISVSCLFSACPVIVKVLAAKEAWTFGLLKWITVPWFVNMFT